MSDRKEILLNGKIEKIYYKYLFNSVLGMLSVSFCILVDTMFIGRGIGSEGLAALNICIPIFNIFNGLGLLFGMGGATALSISIGKGEIDESQRVFTQTLVISLFTGIIISIVGVFNKEQIGYLLGADEKTIILVKEYLSGVLFLSFSYILSHTISSFVRNDHNPKLAMIATSTGGILNIILDYLFIFTFGMGMKGAALATSIASLVNVSILCTHFVSKKCNLKFTKFNFSLKRVTRVLANGAPSFIIELSSGIVIFIFNLSLLKMIGEVGVSAYSIIANVALVVAAIFTGIAQAIQPIISINFGADKYDRVEKVKKMALITAFIVGSIFYITGIVFPQTIVRIFTKESGEIVFITINAIRYYFIAFLIMGLNIVMGAYYQSKEYTVASNIISLSRGIIFLIIGVLILPRIFGVNGIWLTAVFAEMMTFILTYAYIKIKKIKTLKYE
ncbi:MATE family efflux transporter [Romboutsia lituseburensis]|uniref:Multidrug export protein MepA n=1 Tax=Romboutsia lituseburensis DSM 797 TaxID=1121325 RepID=A0A1G9L3V2_9FIRM|nr:MATE family efflux transporter [Romboutsia lituseburensis]CEH35139.1 Na+ driven multidrug efflux pump, MATE efflux [Romboutsia lituseburensis]SDL56433.1 putative efflux protein, MATE family [Romboutsia lituseburensis DSM 797]